MERVLRVCYPLGATDDERREIRWIEEDLERTRKVTATGVASRDDCVPLCYPSCRLCAQSPSLNRRIYATAGTAYRAIAPRTARSPLIPEFRASEVVGKLGDDQ